jgi:hypothetical protein
VAIYISEILSKNEEILKELKHIRELLAAKPAPRLQSPKGMWNEFKSFIEISRPRVLLSLSFWV